MTTDTQAAIAAIAALNRVRALLERTTDQALHDAAEDIGSILVQIESLEYFSKRAGAR